MKLLFETIGFQHFKDKSKVRKLRSHDNDNAVRAAFTNVKLDYSKEMMVIH